MPDTRRIARSLAKRWAGAPDPNALGAHYNGGELRKDWLDDIRKAFGNTSGQEQPFSGSFWGNKLAYDPSFGNVPSYLGPQVTRELDRGQQLPDQIQDELNTTTERVKGTDTTVPDDDTSEPAGYGGSGDTGTKSYQLGHASTAGETTQTAPVAAPSLPSSTAPAGPVAGEIAAPVAPGPTAQPAAVSAAPPAAPAPVSPAPQSTPAPAGNQGVAPALRAPTPPAPTL